MNIEEMDIWALIQNGYFAEACQKADSEYNQTKNIFVLRNKIYALFHLKKYAEAIQLTQQIIDYRNGETSSDFLFCGIAKWLLNEKKDAIWLWKRGEQSIYKDAAGGMDIEAILYFASVKTGDNLLRTEVIKKIKKIVKSKRSINWPGPIGSFLIGDITKEILMTYVSNVPILKERHLCQAYFAIAIKELEDGNIDGYMEKLMNSVSYGPSSYLEQMFYLAKGELELRPLLD